MRRRDWTSIFGYTAFRVLRRQKLAGPGKHEGLQLPDGSVVHLTVRGPTLCSFREFAQGLTVEVVREASASNYAQVMENVRIALSERRPYHAVDWNCERFVRWLLCEPADSPQVTGWFFVAVAAAAVAIAART
jgi:hypothetical protein